MNNFGKLKVAINKKMVIVIGLGILISGCLSANKEKNYNLHDAKLAPEWIRKIMLKSIENE